MLRLKDFCYLFDEMVCSGVVGVQAGIRYHVGTFPLPVISWPRTCYVCTPLPVNQCPCGAFT